jgi:cytosine/adenosine deaminase-related metal-dependent hydrolase
MKTIVWAGKVITDAQETPLEDYAVLVDGNIILETGRLEELLARHPEAAQYGGKNFLLLPALINSHDHGRVLGTAPLGIADDLLEVWIVQQRSLPVIDPYLSAAYSGLSLLSSGVGTVSHLHTVRNWARVEEEVDAVIRGYRDAGIRVILSLQYSDQNPLVYENLQAFLSTLDPEVLVANQHFLAAPALTHEEYIALTHALMQRYENPQHTVEISYCASGVQWCSDAFYQKIAQEARLRQRKVHTHCMETVYQKQSAYHVWGKSNIRHLEDIGVLGPWLILAHMVWVEGEDMDLLRDRQVGVVHNPSSNLRLRSGIAPVDQMLAHGISLGIGLDGFGLDDDQDYLRELRMAWNLSKKPRASSELISAADILSAGTSGGAKVSFSPETKLGKLAPGYLADLLLVDYEQLQGVWHSPGVSAAEVLLQRGVSKHVSHLMVNGDWVIQDGRSTRLELEDISSQLHNQLDADYADESFRKKFDMAKQLSQAIRSYYQQWD